MSEKSPAGLPTRPNVLLRVIKVTGAKRKTKMSVPPGGNVIRRFVTGLSGPLKKAGAAAMTGRTGARAAAATTAVRRAAVKLEKAAATDGGKGQTI